MSTRERLLQAARELFADRGYDAVTVRDISSRAEANLAAVGYHFGDKLRLYRAVIDAAIDDARKLNGEVPLPAADSPPEERLRSYLRGYLPRLAQPKGHVDWFQRLMRHEITTPSPISQELADRIFRPRMQYLADLVAQILGTAPDDPRVRLSVFSIQAQCMFYVRDSFRNLLFRDWGPQTSDEIRAAAEHIADFSIAGVRALAHKPQSSDTPKRGSARRRPRG